MATDDIPASAEAFEAALERAFADVIRAFDDAMGTHGLTPPTPTPPPGDEGGDLDALDPEAMAALQEVLMQELADGGITLPGPDADAAAQEAFVTEHGEALLARLVEVVGGALGDDAPAVAPPTARGAVLDLSELLGPPPRAGAARDRGGEGEAD